MKKTAFIAVVALVFQFVLYGQEIISVTPSYYFTYGDHSNGYLSRSNSVYLSSNIDYSFTPTIAYDDMKITGNFNYHQQTFLGGLLYSDFPHYAKFYYAHLKGDYRANSDPVYDMSIFNYSDFTNIYSLDYSIYDDGWCVGASLTYINAIGILTKDSLLHQQSLQETGRIEFSPSDIISFSIKPSRFISKIDGRTLYSASFRLDIHPVSDVTLKGGCMIGKRAYYFDPDVLTVYNQNETQIQNTFAQYEFSPISGVSFIASYIYSKFLTYHIKYYVAGVQAIL